MKSKHTNSQPLMLNEIERELKGIEAKPPGTLTTEEIDKLDQIHATLVDLEAQGA